MSSSPQHLKKTKQAFTLIEVLIAIAIFSSSIIVLMLAFESALLARERLANTDLLHNDIRAVRMQLLLQPNLDDAEDGGDYQTLENGEAIWQAVIEPTNIVDLFQVQLLISFTEPMEDGPSTYQETIYLLRPTWSESDARSDLLAEKREQLLDYRDGIRF